MIEPKGVLNQLGRSPALAAGLFCCLCTAALAIAIRSETHGLFAYPLDDSYIHLALARTLAFDHVWGMGPAGFASASSSPGWTLVLAAADLLFGSHLTTPIFLNLVIVFGLLATADYGMTTFAPQAPRWVRVATPFLLVAGTPLPTLALLGMEHVAQTFSILTLVLLASRILAADVLDSDGQMPLPAATLYLFLACATVAGSIRYEAVFAVVPIFLLLAWRQRLALGTLVALCSAIGPVAFGLYSHHRSGFWLPFSVLAKAAITGDTRTNLHTRLHTLLTWRSGVPLLWTLLPLWLLRLRSRRFWEASQLLLLLTFCLSVIHMLVAPIGWLMRYESYFVCLSLYALCVAAGSSLSLDPASEASKSAGWLTRHRETFLKLTPWHRALTLIFVIGVLWLIPSLLRRIQIGTVLTVRSAVDRYHEHLQMARFVAASYDHDTLVVDDIGAVAFYSNAHLLDMIGLGSVEPLRILEHGRRSSANDMEEWASAEHASIAILQSGQKSIRSLTPSTWQLVQTWRLPRNTLFDDYDVSFYAIRPDETPRLCNALNRFALTPDDRITFDDCPAIN